MAIVKNNPENNAMLWKVKHMIKVTPIHLPPDLPDDIDPKHCFVKVSIFIVSSHHTTSWSKSLFSRITII